MRSEFGVEERKGIFKGGGAPVETVLGRATITTATSILYASLTSCVFGEKRHPKRQVNIDDAIRYGAYDILVTAIEGSKSVVDQKRISTGVCV